MENTMDMLKTLSQALFVRLFTQLPGRARNQRGASALEYIMLAAVLVTALAVIFVEFSGEVDGVFDGIVECLNDSSACGGSSDA
jgi:pilus assembly protein Flp/PilA